MTVSASRGELCSEHLALMTVEMHDGMLAGVGVLKRRRVMGPEWSLVAAVIAERVEAGRVEEGVEDGSDMMRVDASRERSVVAVLRWVVRNCLVVVRHW